MMRRSTSTVTVLSILSLVTRPLSMRFGIPRGLLCLRPGCRRVAFVLSLGGLRRVTFALSLDRFDPGDFPPRLADAADAFGLAGRALEADVELLLAQLKQQRRQFVR